MRHRSLVPLLIFILVGLVVVYVPIPLGQKEPVERNFHITASSYEFAPGEISVNPGDHVTIELTSTDVVHGLYVDGYNLQITTNPGQTESLSFTADRTGSFRFRCAVTCGDLHPFMIGKLHVGPNTLLWRGFGFGLLSVIALFAIGPSIYRNRLQETQDPK
jgi:heme/copper-type cytochrome/quinol oxidase subunit 2